MFIRYRSRATMASGRLLLGVGAAAPAPLRQPGLAGGAPRGSFFLLALGDRLQRLLAGFLVVEGWSGEGGMALGI